MRTALQAARLRLLLAFLHSKRLAEHCPLALEAGRVTHAIICCWKVIRLTLECPRTVRPLAMSSLTRVSSTCMQPLSVEAQAALDKQLREGAMRGDAAAIERLAQEGASPDATDGTTAVFLAAERGHTAAVYTLVRLGADLNAKTPLTNNWYHPGGTTALMAAAYNGHAGAVAALLRGGARHYAVDENGQTALGRLVVPDSMNHVHFNETSEVVALLEDSLSDAERADWEKVKAARDWDKSSSGSSKDNWGMGNAF